MIWGCIAPSPTGLSWDTRSVTSMCAAGSGRLERRWSRIANGTSKQLLQTFRKDSSINSPNPIFIIVVSNESSSLQLSEFLFFLSKAFFIPNKLITNQKNSTIKADKLNSNISEIMTKIAPTEFKTANRILVLFILFKISNK